MISTGLLVGALIVFLLGMIDYPPINSSRCLCLGLALVVLAQLLSGTR